MLTYYVGDVTSMGKFNSGTGVSVDGRTDDSHSVLVEKNSRANQSPPDFGLPLLEFGQI